MYIDNLPAAPERGASNTAVVTINTGVPISIRVVALGLAVAGSTAQYANVYQITVVRYTAGGSLRTSIQPTLNRRI